MPEKMSAHLERAEATQAALSQLPTLPDLPAAAIAAHKQTIVDLMAKEAALAEREAAEAVKAAAVLEGWRNLWRQCSTFLAIARATAPAELRPALKQIDTTSGFSPSHARDRAEGTLAALTEFPADFSAGGVTKARLQSVIPAQLSADAELDELKAAVKAAQSELRMADSAVDKENKRIYAILKATFAVKGTPEYQVVRAVPTTRPGRATKPGSSGAVAAPQQPG